MGAAAAGETPNTDTVAMNSTDDTPLSVSADTGGAELLGASNEENNILSADTGTFTELNTNIQNIEENGTLTLVKDYVFTSGTDDNFADGIVISTNGLTIDGQDHSIDGNSLARFLTINSVNVTLKNIKFINGNSNANANIYATGDNLNIINCTFTDNAARGYGGAVKFNGHNTTISNCTFTGNSVTGNAGGAGVAAEGDGFTIEDSTFDSNTAGSFGAAIRTTAEGIIDGCTFTNNYAPYQGAINVDRTVIIRRSTFINNSANSGGAIFIYGAASSNSTISECTFINNTATNGGAVTINGANVTLSGCTLTNNTGSAMYTTGSAHVNISHCDFKDNMGASNGAAIRSNADYLNITDCTFNGDKPTVSAIGGAIYVSGGHNFIVNSTFTGHDAVYGGAVSVTGSSLSSVFDNCTFKDCSADYAALRFDAPNNLVKDCRFINNTGRMESGAIGNNGLNTTILDSNFTNNSGPSAGAITCNDGRPVTIIGCIFDGNVGTGAWGSRASAIWSWSGGSEIVVVNSTFKNNVGGSTIAVDGNNATFANLTMTDNEGVAITASATNTQISGVTITGNNGSGIVVNDNNVTIEGVNITDNTGTSILVNGEHNVTITDTNVTSEAAVPTINLKYAGNNRIVANITGSSVSGIVATNPENLTLSNTMYWDGSQWVEITEDIVTPLSLKGVPINIIGVKDNDTVVNETQSSSDDGVVYYSLDGIDAPVSFVASFAGDEHYLPAVSNVYVMGSFTELKNIIDYEVSQGNKNITLNRDFIYVSGVDSGSDGISINVDNLTIDGNGHTVDANASSRIFTVNGNNVTLKNITFNNAYGTGYGGAVSCPGNNITIDSCIFNNNTAVNRGTAVYLTGSNQTIINSEFHANGRNAVIYYNNLDDPDSIFIVDNCLFDGVNSTVATSSAIGASIHLDGSVGDGSIIKNSNFTNNYFYRGNGDIVTLWSANVDCDFVNLTFTNCSTGGTDANFGYILGACSDASYIIENITFDNCTAQNLLFLRNSGGSPNVNVTNITIRNSTGIGITANKAGLNLDTITVENHNGTAIAVANNEVNLDNVVINNVNGTAISVSGDNVNISDTHISNVNGTAINVDGDLKVNITDSSVTTVKVSSQLAVYYGGDHNIIAHITGATGSGIVATNPESLTLENTTYWNGKEWVKITNDNTTSIDLVGMPVHLTGIDDNNVTLYSVDLVSDDDGLVYLNIGNVVGHVRFTATFAGDDFYQPCESLVYDYGGGEFWELEQFIYNNIINGNKIISLSKNYTYTIGVDVMTNGIIIRDDDIVIDGNGYTLDAQGMSCIFVLYGNNITVKNITFINANSSTNLMDQFGYGSGYGAAINIKSVNCTISDCIFMNNTAEKSGGAINLGYEAANTTIINSCFINNVGHKNSGAVSLSGDNSRVINCSFINNTASSSAGAMYLAAKFNCTVIDSVFINNTVGYRGGALYVDAENSTLCNLTFINNTAVNNGGAVTLNDGYINVTECIFIDNNCQDAAGSLYITNTVSSNNIMISNSKFINSTSKNSGGAIYAYGNNHTFINVTFTNNTAGTYGGAVLNKGKVTYVDCTFNGNTAGTQGGALNVDGANTTIISSNFTNNTSPIAGAVALSSPYSIVEYCNFINNTATNYAGALRLNANNQTVYMCNFTNNTASVQGGAINIGAANAVIANSTFTNNSAAGYGGVLVSNGANTTVANSTFTDNTAGTYGGVLVLNGANTTVANSTFTNNTAATYGGVLVLNGANTTVANSTFTSNTAATYGGAIYKSNVNSMIIENSTFTNNTAKANEGGAIYWRNNGDTQYSILNNCNFTDNTAGNTGGAIRTYQNNGMSVTNCNFINNTARSADSGAIILYGNNIKMNNCNFTNNTAATNAGALRLYGTNIAVQNSDFTSNTASTGSGGAIYSDSGNYRYLYNCNFTSNTAGTIAGAVRITGSYAVVDYCEFINNTAGTDGGAFYSNGRGVGFTNSEFINNTAGRDGGAAYTPIRDQSFSYDFGLGTGKVTYQLGTNTNFINNTAGGNAGALYVSSYGRTMTNYNFINNTAVDGGAVYIRGGTAITFKDSEFINNTATGYGGAIYRSDAGALTLTNVNLTHNRAGSVITYNTIGTNVIAHLDGNNGELNAIYTAASLAFTYTNTRYWNGTDYVTESKTAYNTEANKVTPLSDAIVNITVFTPSETRLNTYKVTNESAMVNYDYADVNVSDARMLFLFEGNECYLDSADTGIIFGYGDFYLLQKYINDNIADGNTTILLNRDYTYTVGIDNIVDGIVVNATQPIIIDGDGHVVDALCMSRIFQILSDNVTIRNITLINGICTNGGALYINNVNNTVIDNVKFINNTAEDTVINYGGAIYAQDANNITITDSEFINNTITNNAAAVYGGAIALYTCTNVSISGSLFRGNVAKTTSGNVFGGAIYSSSVNLTVSDSIFEDNAASSTSANANGGAIWGSIRSLLDSNFTSNTAKGDASAVYVNNNPVDIDNVISNCRFTDNHGTNGNGALRVQYVGITINDCYFINNSNNAAGALILCGNSVDLLQVVDNCWFINNTATGSAGGALRSYGLATRQITGSHFINNTAATHGGSIYEDTTNGHVTIVQDCEFVNSTAGSTKSHNGGAICFNIQGTYSVIGCNFTNTCATGQGGALWTTNNVMVNCVDCNFINTSSGAAGGACFIGTLNGASVFDHLVFTNTSSGSAGGAVYFSNIGTGLLKFTNVNIINSTATTSGGAIHVNGGSGGFTMENILFVNTSAGSDSGAVYVNNAQGSTFRNIKFINTTAVTNNGAIVLNTGNAFTMENVEFVNTIAGGIAGALNIGNAQYALVRNVTFINCSANNGIAGALRVNNMGTGSVWKDIHFINTTSSSNGGALYIVNLGNNGKFNTFTFDNCSAEVNGGALYIENTGTVSTNLNTFSFVNCSADANGGAVYIAGAGSGIINLNTFSFVNCSAEVNGGAVYNLEDGVVVTDSTFTGNTAGHDAGAFYSAGNNVNIKNSEFHENIGNSSIVSINGADVNIADCTFSENIGKSSILTLNGVNTVKNCMFKDNSVDETSGIVTINANTTFVLNIASGSHCYDMIIDNNASVYLEDNVAPKHILLNSGQIRSYSNVTVLSNTTHNASTGEVFVITAIVLDDNNNLVIIPDLQFNVTDIVNGESVIVNITSYDNITGVHYGSYLFNASGTYTVGVVSEDSLVNSTDVLRNGTVFVKEFMPINVTVEDIDYLENASVVIKVAERTNGNVTLVIVDSDNNTVWNHDYTFEYEYVSPSSEGGVPIVRILPGDSVVVNVTGLVAGEYSVFVTFLGDDAWGGSFNNTTFTVNKIDSVVNISVDDIVYGGTVSVNVTLPFNATGNVSVRVAGKSYNITEFDISDLNAGVYDVIVVYSGDNNYNSNIIFGNFTVLPVNSNLTVNVDSICEGNDAIVNITLVDSEGNNLTGIVTVKVNDTSIGPVSIIVNNGFGSGVIAGLGVGQYNVTVEYSGSLNYVNSTNNTVFSVTAKDNVSINVSDVVVNVGGSAVVNVNVSDVVNGQNVTITVNGKKQIVTVVDGMANATFSDLKVGVYDVIVSYDGDDSHAANTTNATLTVNKINTDLSSQKIIS